MRLRLAFLAFVILAPSAPTGGMQAAKAQAELTDADLCALVARHAQLLIAYYKDPKDAEARVVNIYGFGLTTAGNKAIYGLQVSGYSKSALTGKETLPDWRTFRLDRLKNVEEAGDNFTPFPPSRDEVKYIDKWICTNKELAGEIR